MSSILTSKYKLQTSCCGAVWRSANLLCYSCMTRIYIASFHRDSSALTVKRGTTTTHPFVFFSSFAPTSQSQYLKSKQALCALRCVGFHRLSFAYPGVSSTTGQGQHRSVNGALVFMIAGVVKRYPCGMVLFILLSLLAHVLLSPKQGLRLTSSAPPFLERNRVSYLDRIEMH